MILGLVISNLVLLVTCLVLWIKLKHAYLNFLENLEMVDNCLENLELVAKSSDALQRVQENKFKRLTMNLVTAHDLIIELLQAQRLHTNMEESHALKALRLGIQQATTPDDRVRWLVSNVPKVIKMIANERLKMSEAQAP